jgi:ABC-2 type transport system permease protein
MIHGSAPAGDPRATYIAYLFPGTMVLILLFTAIFSTISIVEDRREGFLQAVLVAPVSRAALVLGKVMGGASLAVAQALLLLVLAPLLGFPLAGLGAVLILTCVLAVIAFGLTSLGFLIAWRMESTQGFHAIMNVFLIPMWLCSGAFFPLAGAPGWLEMVMRLNPLTYGMASVRWSLDRGRSGSVMDATGISFPVAIAVSAAFALVTFGAAVILVRRRTGGGGA